MTDGRFPVRPASVSRASQANASASTSFTGTPHAAVVRSGRGANLIVLSDGLERGDPTTMIRAVQRLAARAFRIDWFTPLAIDPQYRPETEALSAIRPLLASLGYASSTSRLCRSILAIGKAKAA